jgi:SAM-dependent methyltransferase
MKTDSARGRTARQDRPGNGPLSEIWEAIAAFRVKGLERILNLQCGSGRHLRVIADSDFETYGCDASPNALKFAAHLVSEAELRQAPSNELPYRNSFFDGIISHRPADLGDLRKAGKAVQEMRRVLKSKGMLFLRLPSIKDPETELGKEMAPGTRKNVSMVYNDGARHYFSRAELAPLFKGFRIVSLEHEYHVNTKRPSNLAASWSVLARRSTIRRRKTAAKKRK